MEREHIVAAVLAAAGGQLTGRVRLQKAVYLLEQLGLRGGFSFEYHHYGPYSRELDSAMGDAKAFDLISEEINYRHMDGAAYSVFRLKTEVKPEAKAYGKLGVKRTKELVGLFIETNVTVLELAATIDWLWRSEGYHTDWKQVIRRRKGIKVLGGRLDRAITLLQQLNLAPPETAT